MWIKLSLYVTKHNVIDCISWIIKCQGANNESISDRRYPEVLRLVVLEKLQKFLYTLAMVLKDSDEYSYHAGIVCVGFNKGPLSSNRLYPEGYMALHNTPDSNGGRAHVGFVEKLLLHGPSNLKWWHTMYLERLRDTKKEEVLLIENVSSYHFWRELWVGAIYVLNRN